MTPRSALILAIGLLPSTLFACPGGHDEASGPFSESVHRVKNRVTASGRTIGQVVLATVPRPKDSSDKKLVYGSPEWSGEKHGDGVMVKVTQSPLGTEGSENAITHQWLVKGREIWAVPPNDIDPSLPQWKEESD